MLMYACFLLFFLYFEANRMIGRSRTVLEQVLLYCVFPASAGISILAPMLLKGKAFDLVNRLLTTRPALTRYFLENYGVTLLGEDLSKLDFHYTLDCSYANLLMQGGLLIFLVMFAAYAATIHDALCKKPSAESSVRLAILFAVVISAMSEPFAFNTSYKNISLLLVGEAFYRWTDAGGSFFRWTGTCGRTANTVNGKTGRGSGTAGNTHKDSRIRPGFLSGLFGSWPARLQEKLQTMGSHRIELPWAAASLLSWADNKAAGSLQGTADETAGSEQEAAYDAADFTPFEGDKPDGQSSRVNIRYLVCGVAAGLVLAAVLFVTAPMPHDVYAQRRNCDRVDGYPEMYFSAEVADKLKADENVWLMDYKDSETLMTRFTDEDIMPVERARRSLSGFLAGFAAGCAGAALVYRRKTGKGMR